jgi:O-antigen/teichoic acid export membrane protein
MQSAHRPVRPRIARNTIATAFNIGVSLAVGFALLPLLLHGIGQARTGLFLFATTLTGYFTALDNSVGASITRYVAEHRARDEQLELAATVRSSTGVLAAFGALAAIVLTVVALTASNALFGRHLGAIAEPALLITAATSLLYWPSRAGVAALNGLERYDVSAAIQIVTSLLLLGGIGFLAVHHASLSVLCAVYGSVTVLEGLLSAALAWRPLGVSRLWLRRPWFGGTHTLGVARFGVTAFAIGIADTLVNSFDRTIVGAVVGAAAIAAYDLAQRPQQGVRSIAGLSGLALISPIARLAATGKRGQMLELVSVATLVGIVAAAPIAVLVVVLAHPFLVAWVGSRYARYAFFLQLFTAYWIPATATAALSSALYGIGRLGAYARIQLAVGVVSLPLSIALAFTWGTVGVIWGTAIPSFLSLPFFVVAALRELDVPLTGFLRNACLPGFGPLLLWGCAVIAAKLLLDPNGYPGLVAFSAAALLLFWGICGKMVLQRVKAARRIDA